MWTRQELIELCIAIEAVCPRYGCHVAMTGGCLYKQGPRKDADILFYRIRQEKFIDGDGLFAALNCLGLRYVSVFRWCWKFNYEGKNVDLLFPEEFKIKTIIKPTVAEGSSGAQPLEENEPIEVLDPYRFAEPGCNY
jgi:hypothetical protein